MKGTVRKFQTDKGQKEGFAVQLNILTVLVARASDTHDSQFTIYNAIYYFVPYVLK